MPTITYTTKYKKNEGLVISPEELTALYFYGIGTRSKDGTEISNDTLKMNILSSQQEIERYLEIRFNKKFIEQSESYFKDDYWNNFPIIKTKLPVNTPLSLIGMLNGVEQIKYPKAWLNTKKDSEGNYYKKISIIPTGSLASQGSTDIILTGITAYLGLTSYGQIPNYFTCQYLTGFNYEDLPMDLVNVVGKLSAIGILNMLGDIALGSAGLTSISLGIDGLSQSVSSGQNGAYSGRIKQYTSEINETLKRVKSAYKSINIAVC
jgi:hypothetical protein